MSVTQKKLIGTLDLTPQPPSEATLKRMAEVVILALGGEKGAADKLSWESYYALCHLMTEGLGLAKNPLIELMLDTLEHVEVSVDGPLRKRVVRTINKVCRETGQIERTKWKTVK